MLKTGLLLLVTSFASGESQSVDDIIKKHVDAIGGMDVISKIKVFPLKE